MATTETSDFRHEPRFYPSYPMKIDWEKWRALSSGERASRGFRYNSEIRGLLFERVQSVHPNWSRNQHDMMFFRLCYAGEHFEMFAKAKIARGDWKPGEVETVRATPIPFERNESEKYTVISHPELDEKSEIWPSPLERGSNF